MFIQRLGQIFMPVTIQMQRLYGLTAYLPAILPVSKDSTIPDEVALVFYRTQECYHDAKRCIGGRTNKQLPELAFDISATPGDFPLFFSADQTRPPLSSVRAIHRLADWL